jgi:hypothetical protein
VNGQEIGAADDVERLDGAGGAGREDFAGGLPARARVHADVTRAAGVGRLLRLDQKVVGVALPDHEVQVRRADGVPQPHEAVALLVGQVRRADQRHRPRAVRLDRRPEAPGGLLDDARRLHRRTGSVVRPRGVAVDARHAHPGLILGEVVVQPTVVAHPRVVDRVVAPRDQTLDLVPEHAELDVAAVGTARTDALDLLEEPHPPLVVEIGGEERAHGTDVGRADRVRVVERPVGHGPDVGAVADSEDA